MQDQVGDLLAQARQEVLLKSVQQDNFEIDERVQTQEEWTRYGSPLPIGSQTV